MTFTVRIRKWGYTSKRQLLRTLALGVFIVYLGVRSVWALVIQGYFDQNVVDKIMVVYANVHMPPIVQKQGMFSEFMNAIGALRYAEAHGAAAVRIEFHTDSYVDWRRGPNYWAYYFEPLMVLNPNPENPPEVHFNRMIARYGMFGSFVPEAVGRPDTKQTFPMTSPVPMEQLHRLVSKNIKLQPWLQQALDKYHAETVGSACMVGIHYRGTDKRLIWPYVAPPYSVIADHTDRALQKYCSGVKQRVYLATDEEEIVDFMEQRYPGKLVYQKNSPRASKADANAAETGIHKSTKFSAREKGDSAVMDMLMLSRATYLVKTRSSLSDVAMLMSPHLWQRFTFVLKHPDYVKSVGLD
eukprot:comp4922_c0_seq1/m.1022 comp4922_c0_seq1/g.1022  ORF comp4922_c0_seq1/g.1022 comp4922_c0_seq1/m.1022 type:complete len:355 (-) comp4922_c0_seq1:189-1253(-)